MTLVPVADCCLCLGVDPKTLRLWLKAAQLSCCSHPGDARLKCLTSLQLQHLAELHGRYLPQPLPGTAAEPASCSGLAPASLQADAAPSALALASSPDADLPQQFMRLQAQVAALQEHVTELALMLLREREACWQERCAQVRESLPSSGTPATLPAQAGADPLAPCSPVAAPAVASIPRPRAPASSRALPLIEYWSDGNYGVISPTEGVLALVPDSPQWFDWLATLSSFRFLGQQGRLSASRNKGRASWMAYRRIHGQCYAYGLGQTTHLTLAHLEQMAATLQSRVPAR